jgi:hypothetical protein
MLGFFGGGREGGGKVSLLGGHECMGKENIGSGAC